MPQIYTPPIPYTGANTDAVSDGSSYSSYSGDTLTFNFTGSPSIDRVFVVAKGATDITVPTFSVDSMTESFNETTYDSRRAFLGSRSSVMQSNSITITATGATNIYRVLFMNHLKSLNNSDTRSITGYEVGRGIRNAFIQEDLYGNRSLQTGHIRDAKKTINYTIWQRADNLTDVRNELNELYNIQQQYPNFTIWDIDEPDAQDYESVFQAHWLPDSFSEAIQGTQAISHSFTIEQQ